MENIKIAIREWLQVEAEESGVSKVEEDLVTIWAMPKLPGISHAIAVRIFLMRSGCRLFGGRAA